jgi:Domain of unknown function (DUF2357)
VSREEWSQYVQSHAGVLRLLSVRGQSALVSAVLQDEHRIASFLAKLQNRKDPLLLYTVAFALRPELLDFVLGPLTDLVKAAARSTRPITQVKRGGIRGHVLWPKTLAARATGRMDSSAFAIHVSEKSLDLPENRLLKLFLKTLSAAVNRLEPMVNSGSVSKQLAVLKSRVDQLLRTGWIREVPAPKRMSIVMEQRARRSKDSRYSTISRFQREYEAVFLYSRWSFIVSLLQSGWLEPIETDDLFELYTLFRTMDTLENGLSFGPPIKLGLIRSGRKEVALFRRNCDGAEAQIYFDQSPTSVFGVTSLYIQLTQNYKGLSVQVRRPDLLVRFSLANKVRFVIIECKDSLDDGYRRDSVYKAFAYLRDFRSLWHAYEGQKPKILVVFPSAISKANEVADEIALLNADDSEEIKRLLLEVLSD